MSTSDKRRSNNHRTHIASVHSSARLIINRGSPACRLTLTGPDQHDQSDDIGRTRQARRPDRGRLGPRRGRPRHPRPRLLPGGIPGRGGRSGRDRCATDQSDGNASVAPPACGSLPSAGSQYRIDPRTPSTAPEQSRSAWPAARLAGEHPAASIRVRRRRHRSRSQSDGQSTGSRRFSRALGISSAATTSINPAEQYGYLDQHDGTMADSNQGRCDRRAAAARFDHDAGHSGKVVCRSGSRSHTIRNPPSARRFFRGRCSANPPAERAGSLEALRSAPTVTSNIASRKRRRTD